MGGCRKLSNEQFQRHITDILNYLVGHVQRIGKEIDICSVLI